MKEKEANITFLKVRLKKKINSINSGNGGGDDDDDER